ncbi:MAG: DASS family sodium-coupled anion symporter [Alphaproteobacteria bacterium]|jgi:sodium-dependent dicarboxylate transporter 2/3/5|nr:DASS family sodium-coupled anion symporter [Alphaproteobacteria bacterium]MDP6814665.1 DASS family sodium-coupled anion symporter [Alphaproteobacteria bacterium]
MAEAPDDQPTPGQRARRIGLALGPLVLLSMLLAPAPDGMAPMAWRVAAVGLMMAIWWATEAIPVPATALLPLALFPLLDAGGIRQSAAPYANPLIFLFLGGFLIAFAMQRWGLHRRIALNIVGRVGTRPAHLVAGFMAATAFLSMWISNTATTMMMLPIAASVIGTITPEALDQRHRNLGIALMLGLAYAASIGGIGTLIGTPPNALLAAFMAENFNTDIGFARWLLLGLPLVLVMLPLSWLVLTRLAYPLHDHAVADTASITVERAKLGPLRGPEGRVAAVAVLTALLWITRPLLEDLPYLDGLSDPGIAVACGLLLFVIPAGGGREGFLMDWRAAQGLPWGTLILFGGGLSLAAAVSRSGLADWIGHGLEVFGQWPHLAVIALVAAVIILLTELTSNTATTAAFLPVVAALATATGHGPMALVVPAAMAASCAFMLPVATPPNAIVYGAGLVSVPQMVRAGVWLNLIGVAAVSGLAWLLVPLVF